MEYFEIEDNQPRHILFEWRCCGNVWQRINRDGWYPICPKCGASGKNKCTYCYGRGSIDYGRILCPKCYGRGFGQYTKVTQRGWNDDSKRID